MSALGRIWLGATGTEELLTEVGRTFLIEDFEINREGRVANGDLVIDRIAVKKRFTLAYEAMTQTTLTQLMTLYAAGVSNPLSLLVEEEDSSVTSYTVKFRPFARTRMLAMDRWLWEGVTFLLEEV